MKYRLPGSDWNMHVKYGLADVKYGLADSE